MGSVIAFIFIFFNILGVFDGIIELIIIGNLVIFGTFLSSLFVVLLLPSYPLFFVIFRNKNFNILEKLSFTLIINLSFYILGGFIAFYLTIPLTGIFFLALSFSVYSIFLAFIAIKEFKLKRYFFFRLRKNEREIKEVYSSKSIRQFIQSKGSLNAILFIIFLFLMLSAFTLSVPLFGGTDSWLHISIIKVITEINVLPLNEYLGAMGLHIFSATFHFFSGIDLILIPRFFIFYSFPVSSLIVYNLFRRIFKNKSIAIFGVYMLVFSSLGFAIMMYQFWPSAIAFIQGLFIFYLLYTRFKLFIKKDPPSIEEIKTNMVFNYVSIIIIFVSALMTHSLIIMILLISYLWIYAIYFIKSYKRGIDFFLLCGLFVIFLIFNAFGISTGHFNVFNSFFRLPWYLILGGLIFVLIIVSIFIWHQKRVIDFSSGRYRLILEGDLYGYYKKIEDKYLYPIILGLTIGLTLSWIVVNTLWFNLPVVTVFTGIEVFFISLLSIWGLGIYQNKPKGKILWLWGVCLTLLVLFGFIFDAINNSYTLFSRIFYLTSIVIVVGFLSYIYKLIRIGNLRTLKVKILLFSLITFSLFATFTEEMNSIEIFSLKNREISSIQWYSNYSSEENIIIGEYGWNYVFIYYDYPFTEYNRNKPFNSIFEFIPVNDTLLHPNNHINSEGKNILTELKHDSNGTDIFLILTDYYLLVEGSTLFNQLTEQEIELYYSLPYLNRIYSVKSENGDEIPYYWVI
ncbi:MAG: hypothetical protein EAX89_08360 [Candidatus Lokiarchaeota archaeon]|nr:hypothetical protein [Candidatus Lokiarchaeota archaeon]